ncbi:lipase family alpha/beta hydrolase [Campylobacterota bacterium]
MHFIQVFLYTFIILFSGCNFLNLNEDLKKQERFTLITGQVSTQHESLFPIIIVLVKLDDGLSEVLDYRIVESIGNFSFVTEPGQYIIFAFEDMNYDRQLNDSENISCSSTLDMSLGGSEKNINLIIKDTPDKKLLYRINYLKDTLITKSSKLQFTREDITPLDSERFSKENVKKGLWEPYKFIQEVSFGLFFLNEYDPNKKIVLFIHGINGRPTDFSYIIENIDHSRFQAMVFFYPTGAPLNIVSYHLSSLMKEFQINFSFEKLSLVAHSMGGLVSRAFINSQSNMKEPLVDSFISISTPWNGSTTAGYGLKFSPVTIPVWKDMAPKSEFLNSLFSIPLKQGQNHYLLFSFKGGDVIVEGKGDGVISISSQLLPIAQESATLVRGFNVDHTSILKNKDVSRIINTILIDNF